jgi:hypothetical protein
MPDLYVPQAPFNYVQQPPLVDAQGNINVHGQEGLSIAIKLWSGNPADPSQSQVDISGYTLALELDLPDFVNIPLVPDPGDALGQLLVIDSLSAAGILVTPGSFPLFVIRDTTGAFPDVRWEGRFIVRGWE